MAAQFVVAMITALRQDCRIAWHVNLRLAHNWVRNVQGMSRRTRIPTRWWPQEKG